MNICRPVQSGTKKSVWVGHLKKCLKTETPNGSFNDATSCWFEPTCPEMFSQLRHYKFQMDISNGGLCWRKRNLSTFGGLVWFFLDEVKRGIQALLVQRMYVGHQSYFTLSKRDIPHPMTNEIIYNLHWNPIKFYTFYFRFQILNSDYSTRIFKLSDLKRLLCGRCPKGS